MNARDDAKPFMTLRADERDKDGIHTWPARLLDRESVRLCYSPRPDRGGFDFYVVTYIEGGEPLWESPETTAECIVRGIAYYDGIRHMWWGDPQTGNEAYLYYERPARLIEILTELNKLELEHCHPDLID